MIWTMCLTPLSLLRTLSWSLGILGHCVALYSVLHVLSFGSVAACVLRDRSLSRAYLCSSTVVRMTPGPNTIAYTKTPGPNTIVSATDYYC